MREDRLDSLRKSKWPIFDRTFAAMIKEKHPDIWDEGGNIKGDDQYEILTKIAEQGGVAKTEDQIKAIELREAWVARHLRDYRLPGVVAQIKWLAVGSRGEGHMKNVIRDEISKKELKQDSFTTAEEIGEYLEHQGFSDEEIDDFLEHFGVKGMKWGVRKDRAPGASRATDREARKDAQETARAKMFYGQGAGTRRKLINASVDAKSKKDPAYAKAFEYHMNKQDMSTHSEKARSERSSIDRRTKNKQRAGYIARRLTGEMGTQAAFTAAITAGVIYMNSPRARSFTKTNINIAKKWVANKKNSAVVQNFFKNQGFI